MGDWVGSVSTEGLSKGISWLLNPTIVAKVVGLKDNRFEVQLLNAFERRADYYFKGNLSLKDGRLQNENGPFRFTIHEASFRGTIHHKFKGKTILVPFELEKVTRVSPTMGKKAPTGADVLIDGKGSLDQHWWHGEGKPATWNEISGGGFEVYPKRSGNKKGGDLFTKKTYGSCKMHLEFRMPYEPNKVGQGRGNSGVFFQSHYEVQILDSYGFHSGWTECGALYRVSPSKVNRSRPPLEWQTYDIDFTAAKYDSEGNLVDAPVITVYHNGELIHNEQELFEVPQYREVFRKVPHLKGELPFKLQDHGHKVQFRNMWVLKK
jgi:hypothetical protein